MKTNEDRCSKAALAFTAIAVEMANEEVIAVKRSSSDISSNSSVVTEQRLLARKRREEARTARAAVTRRVSRFEAGIEEARRATSNTGSTVRAEGAESECGSSGVQEVARSSAYVDPLPVLTGAEHLSTMRAELPFSIVSYTFEGQSPRS